MLLLWWSYPGRGGKRRRKPDPIPEIRVLDDELLAVLL